MTIFCRALVFSTVLGIFAATGFSHADTDTPLEISMQHIKKAYKELLLDLQNPQDTSKADYLTLAGTLTAEGKKAREDVPKIGIDMPEDKKAAMVTAYQKSMDDFLKSIDDLSQAIQASQWDNARKQMATLKQEMIDGHKTFRKKE